MATVDVLLPTCNRSSSFLIAMSGLAVQSVKDMRVIVSDQSDEPIADLAEAKMLRRTIEARGGTVEWHYRAPSRGIAEQRDFLLGLAEAPAVLYLDDDVLMEPWVTAALLDTLREEECGFVGAFPAGLSWRHDHRPGQQAIEYWDGPVTPEAVDPGTPEWERAQLHRAANLWHASRGSDPRSRRLYKVAWVASCVLYDREKLLAVGGFSFWPRLPRFHSGEEVLVQNLLMRRWGGCAIIPSGAYYTEVPSTVLNSAGRVDGHALDLLGEMVERYAPETAGAAAG